jgi:ribokinase
MPESSILVVGSINMDLVVRTPRMPAPGETVLGKGFATSPGGKGANQAVAVARQGAPCVLLGRVGNDAFGSALLANLKADGIDCDNVMVTPDAATGVAVIIVDGSGENCIIVTSGANALVTPDDLYHREALFRQAQVVLLQLELPLPTVVAARQLAKRHGCKVVLDPAPAPRCLPDELWDVDVLSPNITEAAALTGQQIEPSDERVGKLVAARLVERGARAAVLKLGHRGALIVTADGSFRTIAPYKIDVVDTTAAGDAFTAALAVGALQGLGLPEATRRACAAGALACAKFGAQAAMPTAEDIRILMEDQEQEH